MLECKDEILAFFKKNLRKATDFIQKASEISTKVIDDVVRLVALLVMIIADNQDIVSLILKEKLDEPIVGLYMTLSKRTAKSANQEVVQKILEATMTFSHFFITTI